MTDCTACDHISPGPDPGRPRTGNKIRLKAVPGMRFGHGVVTDPEVRVPRPPGGSSGRTTTVRCARLRCDCGTTYLASLSELFGDKRKSCGCLKRHTPGLKQVYVQSNKGGYSVVAYLGWTKSRVEADDIARRTKVRVLPPGPPLITGV